MKTILRGITTGASLGVLGGLLGAAVLLAEERYLAQGLFWSAARELLRWATTGLACGGVVGAVAAVPLLGTGELDERSIKRRIGFARGVAAGGAIAVLLSFRFRGLEWTQYAAETSAGRMALEGAGLLAAALVVAWIVVRGARSERFSPSLGLILPLATLVAGPGLAALRPRPQGPNLLLITVDTLRADRLGCYGHAAARTPNIDALAAGGRRFETVVVPAPITLPSTCTIMTGVDPTEHGVHYNGFYRLGREQLTLAELLGEQGYRTGAVIGNYALKRSFGIGQGFESYQDRMTQPISAHADGGPEKPAAPGRQESWWSRRLQEGPGQRLADEVTDAGLRWLERHGEEPFFLWLHYMDPHKPYAPPAAFVDLADPYDGEVAFVDAEIGRLLAGYRARHPEAETLIVFLADHGESLGEHGYRGHVKQVFEPMLRIPFVLNLEGRIPAGVVETAPLSGREVPGEILRALGTDPGERFPTLDARPPAEDDEGPWFYAETWQPAITGDAAPLFALRGRRWKLVYQEGEQHRLFDLESDPGELTDLSERHGDRALELKKRLGHRIRDVRDARREIDAETRRQLGELGYLGDDDEEEGTDDA